jgi:hypothetical protein
VFRACEIIESVSVVFYVVIPVYRFATVCRVRGSNPCGSEVFHTSGPPNLLCHEECVCFPGGGGVNVLGFCINHPTATSAEVKERVELHLYSSYCPSWSIPERNLHFTLHLCVSLTVGFLQMMKVMKCLRLTLLKVLVHFFSRLQS